MSNDARIKEPVNAPPIALRHMMTLQDRIYDTAYQKGWYEENRTFGDRVALMHSELSEALEEFRNGHAVTEVYYIHDKACGEAPIFEECVCTPKPEGVPIELADCVIRILDFCGAENIDLGDAIWEKMIYNQTRPHRHGGKAL